jgi:hypothetical protein
MAKDKKKLEKFQRWHSVFSTKEGKSVLEDLSKMCGYEVSSIYTDINGMVDPTALAIQTGKRAVFTEIKRNLMEPAEFPESKEEDELKY